MFAHRATYAMHCNPLAMHSRQPPQADAHRRAAIALAASTLLHGILLLLFFDQEVRLLKGPAYPGLTVWLSAKPPVPADPHDRRTSQPAQTLSPGSVSASPSPSPQPDSDGVSALQASPSALSAPPESDATAPTHIDIDAAYGIARQAAKSSPGASAVARDAIEPPMEQVTPLSRGMSKAARQDCRSAHAGLGLFALPFLIANTIADRGCKW